MKKTLLSLALLATGVASYAQVSQGSIMLGGDIGYGSTTSATSSTATGFTAPPDGGGSTMNLNINGGYFIMDGMAVGLNVGYNSGSTKMSGAGTGATILTWNNTTSLVNIGLFARKYMEISDKFYFYGGLGFNYMTGTDNNSTITGTPKAVVADPDIKNSGWNISIAPGLAYFPAPAWGIHFGLNNIINYSSMASSQDVTVGATTVTFKQTNSSLNLGVGLTPTLGIAYFIGK